MNFLAKLSNQNLLNDVNLERTIIMSNMRIVGILALTLVLISCKKKNIKENETIVPFDFLSGQTYKSLTIDLVFVEGFGPNSTAIANLEVFLEQRLNKPEGISIIQRGIASPEEETYSVQEIEAIEKDKRKNYTKKEELAAFIFYADADYEESGEDSKVLGIKYGPSSVALFKSSIDQFSGGIGQVSEVKLETTVLKHEFGHLMGLVNIGTDLVNTHEDSDHSGHCDNPDCLMYYATENSSFAELLLGEDIPDLDEQCIQDLQANGGK